MGIIHLKVWSGWKRCGDVRCKEVQFCYPSAESRSLGIHIIRASNFSSTLTPGEIQNTFQCVRVHGAVFILSTSLHFTLPACHPYPASETDSLGLVHDSGIYTLYGGEEGTKRAEIPPQRLWLCMQKGTLHLNVSCTLYFSFQSGFKKEVEERLKHLTLLFFSHAEFLLF